MKIIESPRSGSLAETTASRNRFGQYYRSRTIPTNPASSRQTQVRSELAAYSAGWRGLTAAQRLAWTAWADAHSVVDSLGQTSPLTGHLAFVQVNMRRKTYYGAVAFDAALLPTPGVVPPEYWTAAAFDALGVMNLYYTTPPANTWYEIRATAGMSAGRTFPSRLLHIYQVGPGVEAPLNINAVYTARWGAPVAGTVICCELAWIRQGWLGAVIRRLVPVA